MPETVVSKPDWPEWMQRGIERQSQEHIQAELRLANERAAAMCLEKNGPAFLGEFLNWLRRYAAMVRDIPGMIRDIQHLSSWVTEVSALAQGPQIYQVHAQTTFPFHRSTYSTVEFYLPNGHLITCRGLEGDFRRLDLVPLSFGDNVGAIWPDRIMPLTAKDTASEVVREIVNRIDSAKW